VGGEEEGERGGEYVGDLSIVARLLPAELVAREPQDLESLRTVLPVQLLQTLVLRRESASGHHPQFVSYRERREPVREGGGRYLLATLTIRTTFPFSSDIRSSSPDCFVAVKS